MSAVIKSLNGSPIGIREPATDVIQALEDLLTRAKAGSLHSIYAVCFNHEGQVLNTICDNEWNPYQVVGALAALQARVIQKRDL